MLFQIIWKNRENQDKLHKVISQVELDIAQIDQL